MRVQNPAECLLKIAPSICTHEKVPEPSNGFSWKFIMASINDISGKNPVWVKIGQKYSKFTWRFTWVSERVSTIGVKKASKECCRNELNTHFVPTVIFLWVLQFPRQTNFMLRAHYLTCIFNSKKWSSKHTRKSPNSQQRFSEHTRSLRKSLSLSLSR
jgi:hypothetical protein